MNIYQKLIEIRKNIDVFTKDTKGFNYSYVSGAQVLKKIKASMDANGVVLEPHVLNGQYEIFQYTTDKFGKEKQNIDYIVTGDMQYHWVNAENPEDKIVCNWWLFGQQDEISKAFGSGLTYSERYFLLKYFGIPTDEDDPDKKQEEPSNKKSSQTKPEPPKKSVSSASHIGNVQELKPQCAECKVEISKAEHDFSVSKFKKPLCRTCQKKVK